MHPVNRISNTHQVRILIMFFKVAYGLLAFVGSEKIFHEVQLSFIFERAFGPRQFVRSLGIFITFRKLSFLSHNQVAITAYNDLTLLQTISELFEDFIIQDNGCF